MVSGNSTKERILIVERMFQNGRPITVKDIINRVENELDIKPNRKSIYDDIAVLTRFMPIYSYRQGYNTFYVLDKENNSINTKGYQNEYH